MRTMKTDVRYTWNDGFAIAYQVVGKGRDDLLYLPGYVGNMDLQWDVPPYARFLDRLASFSRLILLDRRGVGCSDRLPPGRAPTLEELVSDVTAVLDTIGSRRATVFAEQENAFVAMLLAATSPRRISRLVLFSAAPSWVRSDDVPDEWSPEEWESQIHWIERVTSGTEYAEQLLRGSSLEHDDRLRAAMTSLLINSEGLGSSVADARMFSEVDVRHVLPTIGAPTLVMRRRGDTSSASSSGRYLAARVQDGRFVELPGDDALSWVGDHDPVIEELVAFLGTELPAVESGRQLATVLFTDIVDSTRRASELGDARWREVLQRHHETVRGRLEAHHGVEVDTAGDGFFATLDGPAAAVRCAMEIVEAIRELDLEVRAGVHTGEVETIDGKVGGIAVAVGARIASIAGPSDVFVSGTVRDLVAGSGLTFDDAGEHDLKGVPDRWRLYRVAVGSAAGTGP
jgi:class 3 adenylate cyclase